MREGRLCDAGVGTRCVTTCTSVRARARAERIRIVSLINCISEGAEMFLRRHLYVGYRNCAVRKAYAYVHMKYRLQHVQ